MEHPRGHWPTLLCAFLYFTVSVMVWMLIANLALHIADEFGLNATQKGLLVALPVLGGSLVRIPLGLLVDTIGPYRTGLLSQLVVLIPLGWLWQFHQGLGELMAIALLLGIAGGSFAIALPLASRWYPPTHQGLVMGLVGAGNSGTMLAALLAPQLAEVFGWRNVCGLAIVPVVAMLAVYLCWVREAPRRAVSKPHGAYLSLWREPDALWFSLFYAFTFGGFVGIASCLVLFFHDQYGLSRLSAGHFAAFCVVAGSFLRPLGGHLADRVGGTRLLGALLLGAAIGLLVLGCLPSLWIATPLLFIVMGLLGMGNGAVFQLVPQRFPQELGVATGLVGAAGGFGGFLLPVCWGISKEVWGSYQVGLMLFGMAGLACFFALRFVQRGWQLSWLEMEAEPQS